MSTISMALKKMLFRIFYQIIKQDLAIQFHQSRTHPFRFLHDHFYPEETFRHLLKHQQEVA